MFVVVCGMWCGVWYVVWCVLCLWCVVSVVCSVCGLWCGVVCVLALTETSEKEYTGFQSNVEMDEYQKFHIASKSSKGGVGWGGGAAIYVNKNFDTIERLDLNINSFEYESMWIEIKSK